MVESRLFGTVVPFKISYPENDHAWLLAIPCLWPHPLLKWGKLVVEIRETIRVHHVIFSTRHLCIE